jgi:hypothetical protein
MSATDRDLSAVEERNLHAYHDDQLGVVTRWWWRRRIARSPRLSEQLDQLVEVGDWVREADSPPTLDLWDAIALRLPAIDAARADAPTDPSGLLRWAGFRPVMAAAATAAVAVVVALVTVGGGSGQQAGAVRWLDTGGRSVIVLDNPEAATIVWLLESPGEGV